jgi:hypothetical protein
LKVFTQMSFINQTCLASALLLSAINVNAADPNRPANQVLTNNDSSNQQRMMQYYAKPFAANSLWNSRPVSPSFSNFVIPLSQFNPLIDSGIYSSGCFFADANHGSMIVKPIPGQKGVYDADAEAPQSQIEIPHWPADLVPAAGGDGHADIYDVANGVIHSFWRLKNINGQWTANLYAWSPINGTGWPAPAHYYQGARAVGLGACAGIIRKSEFASNDPVYPHALAMSLAQNGAGKSYVYPATSADHYSSKNTGQIPEGALVMLPSDFDVSKIKTPALIKIANTLKMYGAYVVDGNFGTPFVIYAETGSGLDLHKNGYNLKAANELHLIRQGLRMVTSAKSWVDASGQPFIPEKNLNILSMRGPWGIKKSTGLDKSDPTLGKYDTWKQAVVFGPTTTPVVQSNPSGRSISEVSWAKPKVGEKFKITAVTSGGGKLRLCIYDKQWRALLDTYDLENGQSKTFVWPNGELSFNLRATSGIGKGSSVSGTLLRVK